MILPFFIGLFTFLLLHQRFLDFFLCISFVLLNRIENLLCILFRHLRLLWLLLLWFILFLLIFIFILVILIVVLLLLILLLVFLLIFVLILLVFVVVFILILLLFLVFLLKQLCQSEVVTRLVVLRISSESIFIFFYTLSIIFFLERYVSKIMPSVCCS